MQHVERSLDVIDSNVGTNMRIAFQIAVALGCATNVLAQTPVQLAEDPTLSPDGETLAFAWAGDIWRVKTSGGVARRLTLHLAEDAHPRFSPNGKRIAFSSERDGTPQVWTMKSSGGDLKQVTFHSEGGVAEAWYPNGRDLLVYGDRDGFWRYADRFMKVSATKRAAERMLFDAYGEEGSLSPDGKKLLFVREGERWWRKGYQGARSSQIWMYDIDAEDFEEVLNMETGCFFPVWKPDGSGFYYCGSQGAKNGARNLWEYDFANAESKQLTIFDDDIVTTPCVSADGRTIVFSHLFDFYRLEPGGNGQPEKIEITVRSDDTQDNQTRRRLDEATEVAFSKDGLEITFIAGGDVWVMDTELREPKQITETPEFESSPVFVDDGASIAFCGWQDGQPDIFKATRGDENAYWWQNHEFQFEHLTHDAELESRLTLNPSGEQLAYVRGRGDLWVIDTDGRNRQRLVQGFLPPDFDFSPDGKWLVYSGTDNDFNQDIWVLPTDSSADAVNISRHPDDESNPVWSPDGKMIAFTGRRADQEVDIYYVWLQDEDNETTGRDRALKKAIEKIEKARKAKGDAENKKKPKDSDEDSDEKDDDEDKPSVEIDFTDIHKRLKRISVANSSESGLLWSPDSKKLAFQATVEGRRGLYTVEFPSGLKPKFVTSNTGSDAAWLDKPSRILWLSGGIPQSQPLAGSPKRFSFRAYQQIDQSTRFGAGFDAAWRVMRDWWYDSNHGNHNWDAVRRKYHDAAADAPTMQALSRVITFMLGELNGSHLGFYPRLPEVEDADDWTPQTAHTGLRFDPTWKGPGLKVRDVIPNGPTDQEAARVEAGEIVLAIDGVSVDPDYDLTEVLNGRPERDVKLRVRSADDEERDLTIRPISYSRARSLLYPKWMDDNRAAVARASNDSLGYLHIQGMNWPSFLEFERELYDVGYGKDGLIIDVRNNGGGFTTDHLLTALTQPRHAITIPRGGGQGYPHSRMVYATWDKPIVVLCNQNSYSNAEIFSHAIKGLDRGRLVGVPTAGGVISTGSRSVMDLGRLRMPFRGWFVKSTGADMELNGAVPHVIIWPKPGEIPAGVDKQLDKAVELLLEDVATWKAEERPTLIKATERE